jgi:hypothetical protein
MTATSQPALAFAHAHLHWCLNQPLNCGDLTWAARVGRAIERLADAWQQRLHLMNDAAGPFAQIAEPGQFAFTPEARRVTQLRRSQQAVHLRLRALAAQFREALALFEPGLGADAPEVPDELSQARAYRLFGVLASCAQDVLSLVEQSLTEENALLDGMP